MAEEAARKERDAPDAVDRSPQGNYVKVRDAAGFVPTDSLTAQQLSNLCLPHGPHSPSLTVAVQ